MSGRAGRKYGRPWNDSDRHGAANEILALDDIALGGFQLAKDCARRGEERSFPSSVSRTDRPRRSKRRAPSFLLELDDLLRKRRLSDMRLLRGAAEAAVSATAQK